jgi:hypothetical protein
MVLGWWNLWWNKNDASVTVILQSGYTIMIYYDLLWSIYSGCIWEKLDDRRFWSETKSEAWLGRRGWWSVTGGEVTVIIHSGDQRGVAQLWQLWQPINSFFFLWTYNSYNSGCRSFYTNMRSLGIIPMMRAGGQKLRLEISHWHGANLGYTKKNKC